MDEQQKLKIAVLGFASNQVAPWDPSTAEKGLPGSEECVVYGTEELASRGHKVVVYMNPPQDSPWRVETSNPRWIPESAWCSETEEYDLVLMWRRTDVDTGRKHGKNVIFWPHDSYYRIQKFPLFDGVFVLSNHHRMQLSQYEGFTSIPYTISGNGILPRQFETPGVKTNPYSVGYFSNYARGLEILIAMWPTVRKLFPEATLSICYGRETWNLIPQHRLNRLVSKIEEYKSIGVTEHGKVGHSELAEIMKSTSIWSYPCTDSGETFCITAAKCQAAGCIPVTTRIGALNETVHPEASCVRLIENVPDAFEYQQLLLDTLSKAPSMTEEDRKKYRDFSMKFVWANCVDKWLELYEKIK